MGKIIIPQKQVEKIIYNYQVLKMAQGKAGQEFGYSAKIVKRLLQENNVYIRSQSESRQQYHIKENYFNTETSNMAYILGLLASDGCVASNKNLIYIELQRSDKELLEKVNQELENERPVKDYCASNGYENSKIYFYSKQAKEQLAKYKIIPNKTYSENFGFPTNLQKKYWIDYIRGYFDGDGCIKDSNHTPTWEINSVNYEIIETIQKFFLEEFNIQLKIQTFINNRKIPMYRVYCYGQENCHKIFDILYNNTNLFLTRKKEKFKSLLK